MDEDFLLERSVEDGSGNKGSARKKTRFELDLEKYGSIDAVRSAKTDTDENEGVSMARKRGGSAAVNSALSQSVFDGQTDPDDDSFDDDFSKYILSANDKKAPSAGAGADYLQQSDNEFPADDAPSDDDISGFRFDDEPPAKKKKVNVDFAALADEVFDEEALIALGKSIQFGKKPEHEEEQPAEDSFESDDDFSPEVIVNDFSDRFAPFEFEPVITETVVYENPGRSVSSVPEKSQSQSQFQSQSQSQFKSDSERFTAPPSFETAGVTEEPEQETASTAVPSPAPEPVPEKRPVLNAAAFADLAEMAAAAEAAAVSENAANSDYYEQNENKPNKYDIATEGRVPTPDDMDTAPEVLVDDNTVFPAEPPISVNIRKPEAPTPPMSRYDRAIAEADTKSAPKTAREIARAKLEENAAKGISTSARSAQSKSAPATASVSAPKSTSSPAQTETQSTTRPRKEIISLRELASGFNDAEYEKQTGTLPVLGELTDEFSGGKRISGKTTRTDDQIQLMRKQEALAMNILSEDSSEAGTVRAERIIYDVHEKNQQKQRLFGIVSLITANALLIIIGIIGMIAFEEDNSGLAFLFRATIGFGVFGFIPVKFIQKLIAPFFILTAMLYVVLGFYGEKLLTAPVIIFFVSGAAVTLLGFVIRFFFGSVKSLFERRKP
jgi:hypothetical protein